MKMKRYSLGYIFSEVKRNWKYKRWWEDRITTHLFGFYYSRKANKGVFITGEDWDNLIILDALRHDTFQEVTRMKVDYKLSRGSHTKEFLKENFDGKKFNDIVYITATPVVNRDVPNAFYKILLVWKYEWDENPGTVHPKVMKEYALKAEQKYPNKRLIIHFLQPHQPYIGDPQLYEEYKNVVRHNISKYHSLPTTTTNIWYGIRKGQVSLKRVYEAYKRNLKIALPYTFELAEKLRGKTVITADHGELFGDFLYPLPLRGFWHPIGLHVLPLIKVPWLVFERKERKTIKERTEKDQLRGRIKNLKQRGVV